MTVPFKPAMEAGLFKPTDNERRLFSQLNGLTLKTTLFSSSPQHRSFTFPEEMWLGPLNCYNGHLRSVRNSSVALHGQQLEARPRAVAYQAERQPPTEARGKELRSVLVRDLDLAGLEDVKIEYEKNVRLAVAPKSPACSRVATVFMECVVPNKMTRMRKAEAYRGASKKA
jgi:hypothetical protein